MVLSIVFYKIVDYFSDDYLCVVSHPDSGVPPEFRPMTSPRLPEPSEAVFAEKLTTCYEHPSDVCLFIYYHVICVYFILLLVTCQLCITRYRDFVSYL